MQAIMISKVKIKDEKIFNEYLLQSKSLASNFGAELLFRGKFDNQVTESEFEHDLIVIVKFPTVEKVNSFFNSDEYKELIPLREKGSHQEIGIYSL